MIPPQRFFFLSAEELQDLIAWKGGQGEETGGHRCQQLGYLAINALSIQSGWLNIAKGIDEVDLHRVSDTESMHFQSNESSSEFHLW